MEDPSIPPPAASASAAHVAHVANPTPVAHVPVPLLNHPPYSEMITAAITALNERNGSSKRAIAKYIEDLYCNNLPPTHPTLLTHHLKWLKSNGQLIMVKHSYMLPRSTSFPTDSASVPLSTTDTTCTDVATVAASASSNGIKRSRGRPPKQKLNVDVPPSGENGSEAMLVSLGLVDGPGNVVKKSRGRPRKTVAGAVLDRQPMATSRRGRPTKPKLLPDGMILTEQKKHQDIPPGAGISVAVNVSRPRGRPRKGTTSTLFGKPRGRPRKVLPTAAVAADAGIALPAKRRGRPSLGTGLKKLQKLSGKPVGRPRKNAPMETAASSNTHYLVAYEHLKTKYENIQSKVQLAVSLIKPHLNNDSPVNIVRAVEELEGTVTLEMTAVAPANLLIKQSPHVQN